MATVKENDLTESLKITIEENGILGDALENSTKKLGETEYVLEILKNKLNLAQETLESIKCNLKVSGMRETEVMAKLKFADETRKCTGTSYNKKLRA